MVIPGIIIYENNTSIGMKANRGNLEIQKNPKKETNLAGPAGNHQST